MSQPFRFQQFSIAQDRCAMKVTSDAILFGAWAARKGGSNILDIGSGTGVLSLMAAQLNPEARVIGVEIEEVAARQAKENVAQSPFSDRVVIENASILDHQSEADYDLIISNPPFFTAGILSEKEKRASVRHTLQLSHQALLESVQRLMTQDGVFCVLLPVTEGVQLIAQAADYGLHLLEQVAVKSHAEKLAHRLLLAFDRHGTSEPLLSSLVLHDAHQNRTEGYKNLVKGFYLGL